MEIETFNAMNESMHSSLLTMIEVVAAITILFAIAGLSIYLAGIAWFCLEEKRRGATAPRKARGARTPNALNPARRMPYAQARTIFINNRRAYGRGIARPHALLAVAAPTPPAKAPKAG